MRFLIKKCLSSRKRKQVCLNAKQNLPKPKIKIRQQNVIFAYPLNREALYIFLTGTFGPPRHIQENPKTLNLDLNPKP